MTLRTVAKQATLYFGFPRQEYLSGLLLPSPGDLPDAGVDPLSPMLQANSLTLSHWGRQIKNLLIFKTKNLLFKYRESVHYSSITQSCPTLCGPMDPMGSSMPGFLVHYQLLELTQIHVHPVSDSMQASYLLSYPSPQLEFHHLH